MNEKVVQSVCYCIEQVACVASGSSSLYLYDVESVASVPRQVRPQQLLMKIVSCISSLVQSNLTSYYQAILGIFLFSVLNQKTSTSEPSSPSTKYWSSQSSSCLYV